MRYFYSLLLFLVSLVASAASFPVVVNPSPIVIAMDAARYSGVAPLYVSFSAIGTTATGVVDPFHDLEYKWDFGDPSSGNWPTGTGDGATPKNIDYGPIAAHVYKTPGEYTVSLTVYDGTNTNTKTIKVTVTDPDVVFGGGSTYCIRAAGGEDFDGCPAIGAGGYADATACISAGRCATESDFSTILTSYVAADNRRVLLRRGSNYTATVALQAFLDNRTNVTLGAYGTGGRPIITPTYTPGSSGYWLDQGAITDCRVMDIEFDLGSGSGRRLATTGSAPLVRLTWLNVHIKGGIDGFVNEYEPGSNVEFAIVDSTFSDIQDGTAFYGGTVNGALMGNNIYGMGSHSLRLPMTQRGVISHNTITRNNAEIPTDKIDRACIRLLGTTKGINITGDLENGSSIIRNVSSMVDKMGNPFPKNTITDGGFRFSGTAYIESMDLVNRTMQVSSSNASYVPNLSSITTTAQSMKMTVWGGEYTEHVIISENKFSFDMTASWCLEIHPQSSHNDERQRDVIVERNLFIALPGSNYPVIGVSGRNHTIRNNLFSGSRAYGYDNAIQVKREGDGDGPLWWVVEPDPGKIQIYNNSIMADRIVDGVTHGSSIDFFTVGPIASTTEPVVFKNNLVWRADSDGTTNAYFLRDTYSLTPVLAGNSTDAEIRAAASNPFAANPALTPADFATTVGSYARTRGVTVPGVYIDFNRTRRTTNTIGAIGP